MKPGSAISLVSLTLLAGCVVGPDYQRPEALDSQPLPARFGSSTNEWKIATPAAHLPRGTWWLVFQDPELHRLETLLVNGNQTLAGAVARFDRARAEFNLTRADLFPHLNATGAATRQRTSAQAPQAGKAAGAAHTYNTFTTALTLGWEADLWGRVRREAESAQAAYAAAADDLAAVQLALQAELATDYFTLRALNIERALVTDTIDTFRRSLELTRDRRKGGIVSDLDVAQAETQLRTAEAQLPALDRQHARLMHALAILCGQPATLFSVAPPPQAQPGLPLVPASLPSELLERRPDIAAAERRMALANAQVGVAQAAFFPRLRLNGLAGFQSIEAGSAFNWSSRMWSVGPALDLPLFTGGHNRAQLAAAHATYQATVADYRQTVLNAFADVEDQLAARQYLAAQLDAERAALAAAKRALAIANNRYAAGLVTFLEVATAQSAALQRERSVAQLEGAQNITVVGLIRALGGGWDTTQSLAEIPP
ncbi:MAG TPA: efflux transporter outer membrane subunit [Verrucomicrobiota bacterium]|nr:efflux transporter outer membrane subunit [Verrucomicrobiota bacterium]HNT15884.1 efflux transporter outer membrane subunit [Verrucomicrobiota bacterium]